MAAYLICFTTPAWKEAIINRDALGLITKWCLKNGPTRSSKDSFWLHFEVVYKVEGTENQKAN